MSARIPARAGVPRPCSPHEARGVAVVHHELGVEGVAERAHGGEVGEGAVHGEDAVGGDQDVAGAAPARRAELAVEIVHVVVLEAEAARLGQADAVDDGGVVQAVGDHGVLVGQERLEERAVGVEGGGEEDGVVEAEVARDPRLERLVEVLGAADEPDGGEAEAAQLHGGHGGGGERGVVGQAQVVVGAKVQDLAPVDADARALGGGDHRLLLPEPLGADAVEAASDLGEEVAHAGLQAAWAQGRAAGGGIEGRRGVPLSIRRRGRE